MTPIIDIRTDTVTKPTEQMRAAMYAAEVGDDGRLGIDGKGEDPTVRELERLAASTLGKEDALLMPSGTMANLVALMTHCSRGNAVAVGSTAHIYRIEKGAFAEDIYGLRALEVPDAGGHQDLGVLQRHLTEGMPGVCCIENTHNYAGGTVLTAAEVLAVADLAHSHGVPVHMDGARIFNAAVALETEAQRIAQPVDSLMFCLSKGLSAPVGSMLVGTKDFIKAARERRKLIGGQMRQAGVFAAAGIVALQGMVSRLSEDHEKARQLAGRLAQFEGLQLDPASVQTNMVKIDTTAMGLKAGDFQRELRARGVLVNVASPFEVRMVTHRNVTLEEVLTAAEIIGGLASELVREQRTGIPRG